MTKRTTVWIISLAMTLSDSMNHKSECEGGVLFIFATTEFGRCLMNDLLN